MSGQPLSGGGSKKGSRTVRRPVQSKVFAVRSPIIDLATHVWAYELDFVEVLKTESGLQPSRPTYSSVCTFLDTLTPWSLTSGRLAFLRADTQAFGGLSRRAHWTGRIVYEFDLSGPEGNDMMGLLTCLDREKAPFCLSNVTLTEETRPLFFSECFVKIDVANRKEEELASVLSGFRELPVRAIASSVHSREDLDVCSRLGFELFSGGFFRKPSSLTRSSISPNHALLLDLSARTAREEDIGSIEDIFKKNPDLAFGLFNLVRSAYFGVSKDVTSIRQAVALLGYKNLQKWAALMLFTINHSDPADNPLFENVLVRARTMELAAAGLRRKGVSESAYMTGIFSLVPALFNVSMEEMVETANFGQEIREALLKREGRLGAILGITEDIENGEYEKALLRTDEAGIDLAHFLIAQTAAFAECSALAAPPGGEENSPHSPALQPVEHTPLDAEIRPGLETLSKAPWFTRVRAFFHHS
jgi:c-di-GMP-related signal transduction protein